MADKIVCGRGKTECKGANHGPTCPIYLDALQKWDPPKPKTSKGGKHRTDPKTGKRKASVTPEEKAAIARENGKKGGRPQGTYGVLPQAAMEALKTLKFRQREEYAKDPTLAGPTADLAHFAMERIALVTAGRVSSKRAPSILKGAIYIRTETCQPPEVVSHVKTFDLPGAVRRATEINRKKNEGEGK